MYLVYVDDYGHTGVDLANPQQPLYMLFAILVPEEKWVTLEGSLWALMAEIAQNTGQDLEGFELHAKEFFNGRNKLYSSLGYKDKVQYLITLIDLLVSLDCKCISTYVVKKEVQVIRENAAQSRARGEKSLSRHLLEAVFPHPLAFSRLLAEVDNFSKLAGRNSIIIIDHQEEYAQSRRMHAHSLQRRQNVAGFTQILDMPFDGDGRYNLMLQIADMVGWAFGRHLKSVILGEKRDELLTGAMDKLLPSITAVDALNDLWGTVQAPLGVTLLLEYVLRAEKTVSGIDMIRMLSVMSSSIAKSVEIAKEKGQGEL